jgi:hypothetical protein
MNPCRYPARISVGILFADESAERDPVDETVVPLFPQLNINDVMALRHRYHKNGTRSRNPASTRTAGIG